MCTAPWSSTNMSSLVSLRIVTLYLLVSKLMFMCVVYTNTNSNFSTIWNMLIDIVLYSTWVRLTVYSLMSRLCVEEENRFHHPWFQALPPSVQKVPYSWYCRLPRKFYPRIFVRDSTGSNMQSAIRENFIREMLYFNQFAKFSPAKVKGFGL